MGEKDGEVLRVVLSSPGRRTHIGHIAKYMGISYMTARKRVDRLCDLGALRRDERPTRRPCYYEVTELGRAILDGLVDKD